MRSIIYCFSAGVGRTGTVILIDSMYQMGLREQAVDVPSHLAVIRQQRANLCANLAQYHLVHQVLVELLVSPSAAVPAALVASRLAQLRAPGADGRSQLELQLQYLDEHRPTASHASLRGLQLKDKNRSPEVLPGELRLPPTKVRLNQPYSGVVVPMRCGHAGNLFKFFCSMTLCVQATHSAGSFPLC